MARQTLGDYRGKRDFARTGEPAGGAADDGGNRFVVHKHHATADHYDLRLQVGGVLKSWAVPKGPSLDPAEKRLAVETEDHPLEYVDFEGVIPEGEYGGGPMIVWDAGTWAPMEDVEKSLAAGAFKFRLAGEKLAGGWMLARLKGRPGEKKTNWLLFKERDQAADAGRDILVERPESVKSGRRIEELVAPPPAAAAKPGRKLRPGAMAGAVQGPGPDRLTPQLASPVAAPPEGADWLHEIKLDGYRTLAFVEAGGVRLITRGGLDWTHRYGDLADAFRALPCREAVVDGEIVVLDGQGISRFALLQDALSRGARSELVFYAFDLVRLDGWNLAGVALEKRKALLGQLLAGATGRSAVQFSDHVKGGGPAFYEQVSQIGLEGVVSKRASAPYQPGRSKTWVKAKAKLTGDFVIVGFTLSEKAEGLAALALGEWVGGELVYRGKVGTGFDAATLADLRARLAPLEDPGLALEGGPRDVHWVRPVHSARIQYSNITADGSVRHGVFAGLRDVALTAAVPAPRMRLISEADLATVWVTNPTRRLFGRSGPTKLDVAVYYAAIGDFMLPHLFGRPVSLVRCPTGKPEDCFFQRHKFLGMPAGIDSFETRTGDEEDRTYLTVATAKGYLALAQFGVIEFHAWGCRVADPRAGGPRRLRPRSRRGRCLARGGRGGGACARRAGGTGADRFRQDHRGQGGARGGAGDAEAGLEGGACGDRRDCGGHRQGRAGHLHHGDGSRQPEAADLHRFSPECPECDGCGALFVAFAQQSAGFGAFDVGQSREYRRSGGFELFFASGSGRRNWRSLGRDR